MSRYSTLQQRFVRRGLRPDDEVELSRSSKLGRPSAASWPLCDGRRTGLYPGAQVRSQASDGGRAPEAAAMSPPRPCSVASKGEVLPSANVGGFLLQSPSTTKPNGETDRQQPLAGMTQAVCSACDFISSEITWCACRGTVNLQSLNAPCERRAGPALARTTGSPLKVGGVCKR